MKHKNTPKNTAQNKRHLLIATAITASSLPLQLPKQWTTPLINTTLLPATPQPAPPHGTLFFEQTNHTGGNTITIPTDVCTISVEIQGAGGGGSGGNDGSIFLTW